MPLGLQVKRGGGEEYHSHRWNDSIRGRSTRKQIGYVLTHTHTISRLKALASKSSFSRLTRMNIIISRCVGERERDRGKKNAQR